MTEPEDRWLAGLSKAMTLPMSLQCRDAFPELRRLEAALKRRDKQEKKNASSR